jgi:hypothetical protein
MGILDKLFGKKKSSESPARGKTLDTRENSDTKLASELGMTQIGGNFGYRILSVAKELVIAEDISDINQISSYARTQIKNNGKIPEWNLSISGYDYDPRDLWEIPEVRQWCKKAYSTAPYLPCILSERSIAWFLPCISEIETGEKRKRVLSESEQSYLNQVVSEAAKNDPREAQRLKTSMEWVTPYRIKPQEKLRFTDELPTGISKFLWGTGLSEEQILQIVRETAQRMVRFLT